MLTLFPFLAPQAANADLCRRLRRLAHDLDRIGAGEAPSAAELAAAPRLEDWRVALTPAGLSLAGFVTAHPILGTKAIVTSPLWVVDPALSWARTLSRFYVLGAPARDPITVH
jgi:hypothetical protein